MKKIILFSLGIIMAFSLTACGMQKNSKPTAEENAAVSETENEEKNSSQLANPFIDSQSLDDAEKRTGIRLTLPDHIDGYDNRLIQTMEEELVQVIYSSPDNELIIRKALGTEDISGDYNKYESEEYITVDDRDVTIKTNDKTAYTALWFNDDYAFSIHARSGMDMDRMISLIKQVE